MRVSFLNMHNSDKQLSFKSPSFSIPYFLSLSHFSLIHSLNNRVHHASGSLFPSLPLLSTHFPYFVSCRLYFCVATSTNSKTWYLFDYCKSNCSFHQLDYLLGKSIGEFFRQCRNAGRNGYFSTHWELLCLFCWCCRKFCHYGCRWFLYAGTANHCSSDL